MKGSRTRTKLTKVKVPMKANRMQKPMPKAARSGGLRKWSRHARIAVRAAAAGIMGLRVRW